MQACVLKVFFREGFFLVPVSPPVHCEGIENRQFFFWTGDFVNSTFLSGQFCEQHGCTEKTRAKLWGAVERGVCFYVLCTSIHQHIEPTALCAEFVTWIAVLRLCLKAHSSLAYTPLIGSVSGTKQLTTIVKCCFYLAPARPFFLATFI